jgi:hypothetical protein
MTAEIAIVNRHAIALAADSAVTTGRERVWKSGNKLFSLGPKNDIAIMIYGSGEFAGFPWEALVKIFRASVRHKFRSTKECADSFMEFLRGDRFRPDERNRISGLATFIDPLQGLKAAVGDTKKSKEFRERIAEHCAAGINAASDFPEIQGHPTFAEFRKRYDDKHVFDLTKDVLDRHITKSMFGNILRFLFEVNRRQIESQYSTGIVIAGYGDTEMFPTIIEFVVDGKDAFCLRAWERRTLDFNGDDSEKVAVIPFGQSDIFHLFMEGISPESLTFIDQTLRAVLLNKSQRIVKYYVKDSDESKVELARQKKDDNIIIDEFSKQFGIYRAKSLVRPILDVVRALPKEELADMAQAMVELTSLRRKVDSPLESVGGPVDIAIISKGDGLIWIKRKHYFDIDKNRDFLYRRSVQMEIYDGLSDTTQ